MFKQTACGKNKLQAVFVFEGMRMMYELTQIIEGVSSKLLIIMLLWERKINIHHYIQTFNSITKTIERYV